ncbi:MAG TPA: 3-hydroxyacyl-ACP dehydratase [Flavobacterium sp.]|jgi:3-hydroxyacyl-[acyl-carrier-protein] dehydratase|nr:3-hydroxyacyl-ACP dehydratase [Flavobacterium sp.]
MLNDFYLLQRVDELAAGKYAASVVLNPSHEIFKGHFPGNPVTPGVCMMQIIKDLAEDITGFELRLQSAINVKFMALINPFETPNLQLELDIQHAADGTLKVKNTTSFGDTIALKLSSIYLKV